MLLEYKKESWEHTHRINILNSIDQENWFQKITSSPTTLVMIAETNCIYPIQLTEETKVYGKRIGLYILDNIDWQNGSYDMSYGLFEHCRRCKFGPKLLKTGIDFSFDILNLRRINCEVLATNHASIACVGKVKFQLEGVRKEAIYRFGQKIDSHIFGLLKG